MTIKPDTYRQLRTSLLHCWQLEGAHQLHSLLADPRLRAWQHVVPQQQTTAGSVDTVISLLQEKQRSDDGRNALVLFLEVLSERIDPGDACHAQLRTIARQLAEELAGPSPPQPRERQLRELERYLPFDKYRELELALPEAWGELCLDFLKRLLATVLTYVPRQIAVRLLQEPQPPAEQIAGRFEEGTLLFADLSDFVRLSDALRQQEDKAGAEALARLVDSYLEQMLGTLYRYNGQLIKFGGDSMLCLFTGQNQGALNAVRAAWEMKERMAAHAGEQEIFQELSPLRIKVGNSSGRLFSAVVGSDAHLEYILTGSAVERTAQAGSAAERGEIVLSADTYQQVKTHLTAEQLAGKPGFYRVAAVADAPVPAAPDPWQAIEAWLADTGPDPWAIVDRLDALVSYLPAGLLPQLVYAPSAEDVAGQHRQVTVLAANLVGMSDAIDAYGPGAGDQITAVVHEYFQTMQEEIHYYGGIVNKVDPYDQGDKLMVLFGAPTANERDALRASLTALAMQEAMTRLAEPAAAAFLSQRIGVHTGLVFAGNIGSADHHRREYTVMGETVAVAGRLMALAAAGQVFVSERVARELRDGFELADLPAQATETLAPARAVRLVAVREALTGLRPSLFPETTLVGRQDELDYLQDLSRSLQLGDGKRVVAIVGEAGVGKTRLVHEWQARVAGQSVEGPAITWLTGQSHALGQSAFGPFIQVLEQLCGIGTTDAQVTRWNKLAAFLKEKVPRSQPGWINTFTDRLAFLGHFLGLDLSLRSGFAERIEQLEPDALQLQTRLALSDTFSALAADQPVIVILEDMERADTASLELLRFLVDRVADDAQTILCLLFRPLKERPIWLTWQEMQRIFPDCIEIALQELDENLGRKLLQNLLAADETLDRRLVTLIQEETDGNPLYIEEVLYTLVEEGLLVQGEDNRWQLSGDLERVHVPGSLYQIIQSRIDALDYSSPGARRLLWLAAVLGKSFGEAGLRHLFAGTGREGREYQRHRRQLLNAAMLERARLGTEEGTTSGYQFRHGLVQQVAYDNMPVAYRRRYHELAGLWLEDTHRDNLTPHYETLAHHFDRSQSWDKAFYYHAAAARRDAGVYANEDAVAHFQRALELAVQVKAGLLRRAALHDALGRVLVIVGEYDGALSHFQRAFDLYAEREDEETLRLRARSAHEIGRIYERQAADLDQALAWRDKGLALLPGEASAEAALLHTLGGIAYLRRGALQGAMAEAGRALELAEASGARAELGFAHRMLSIAHRALGELPEALDHCRQSAAICHELADLVGLGKDLKNQGVISFELDDWRAAEAAYLDALATHERVGDRLEIALTCANLGDLYAHRGELDKGFAHARRALAVAGDLEAVPALIMARLVLATLHLRREEYGRADEELQEAGSLAESAPIFRPTVQRWQAQLALDQGDLARAEELLTTLSALDGDMLADEAEPVQRLQALLLAGRGDVHGAEQRLAESIRRLETAEMRYQLGLTHLALAQLLAGPTDRAEEARVEATAALAIFRELGAALDEKETRDLQEKM